MRRLIAATFLATVFAACGDYGGGTAPLAPATPAGGGAQTSAPTAAPIATPLPTATPIPTGTMADPYGY